MTTALDICSASPQPSSVHLSLRQEDEQRYYKNLSKKPSTNLQVDLQEQPLFPKQKQSVRRAACERRQPGRAEPTHLQALILAVVVHLAAVGVASLVQAPGRVVARVHLLLLLVLAVLVIVAPVG